MSLIRVSGVRTAFGLVATAAIAWGMALAGAAAALEQTYPARVVKIVVPFPAGGPLDFTARLLADKLAASLKQPFVVENRAGASGNIGTDAVAKAAPDGQTLLFVLDTPLTANPTLYKRLSFDPDRDFVPISLAVRFSQMLVVPRSLPVTDVANFVAFAKSTRPPMTYGSGGGRGDPGHLTMEYFRTKASFEAVHVPYKGNQQVVMDLIGAQVQSGFIATPGVLAHVKEGTLKALAVSGSQRSLSAPHVPTIAEAGYPGFDVEFYQVMLAPAGVPESIRALLEREVRQALQLPDVQARLTAQDMRPIGSSGPEAAARLQATADRWRQLIKTAGITVD